MTMANHGANKGEKIPIPHQEDRYHSLEVRR
jgi:hypothetical protein